VASGCSARAPPPRHRHCCDLPVAALLQRRWVSRRLGQGMSRRAGGPWWVVASSRPVPTVRWTCPCLSQPPPCGTHRWPGSARLPPMGSLPGPGLWLLTPLGAASQRCETPWGFCYCSVLQGGKRVPRPGVARRGSVPAAGKASWRRACLACPAETLCFAACLDRASFPASHSRYGNAGEKFV